MAFNTDRLDEDEYSVETDPTPGTAGGASKILLVHMSGLFPL